MGESVLAQKHIFHNQDVHTYDLVDVVMLV